jgi:predicted nuclease of predicted toxin-antitoxin system
MSAAIGPSMLLLSDENVPMSVATFFRQHGHDVRFVRDLVPTGTLDPIVAMIGDKLSAIVVTTETLKRS